MSAAPKKIFGEQPIDPGELTTERELKLAKNFSDPALEELIPSLSDPRDGDVTSPSIPSINEEAVAAVRELVGEASGEPTKMLEFPFPENFEEIAMDSGLQRETSQQSSSHRPDSRIGLAGDSAAPSLAPVSASSLFEVSNAFFDLIICDRSFDELVHSGLKAIMGGLSAHAGSVLELDHEKEDFFFRASHGGATNLAELKAFRVPLTKGIVGHVAETGRSLLIKNLSEDKLQMRAISLSVGFEAITCMAAPIIVGGQPYGVIEVFNKIDGSYFEESDLHVLEEGVRMFTKVLEVRFLMAELVRRRK